MDLYEPKAINGDPLSTVKVSMCIRCRHCDIAVACGSTAVVNCLARKTVIFNSRVAYCRIFEQREKTQEELKAEELARIERERFERERREMWEDVAQQISEYEAAHKKKASTPKKKKEEKDG